MNLVYILLIVKQLIKKEVDLFSHRCVVQETRKTPNTTTHQNI